MISIVTFVIKGGRFDSQTPLELNDAGRVLAKDFGALHKTTFGIFPVCYPDKGLSSF